MTKNQLIVLYLFGWVACIYIGMRIEAWRWKKRVVTDIRRAYERGVAAGLNREKHIQQQRDELTSSVRILTGEEGYDDESFAGPG